MQHQVDKQVVEHTRPRESKAEIKKSNAPIRLRNTGISPSILCIALACVVYVSTLRTFCRSEADSMQRPSSAFEITCLFNWTRFESGNKINLKEPQKETGIKKLEFLFNLYISNEMLIKSPVSTIYSSHLIL